MLLVWEAFFHPSRIRGDKEGSTFIPIHREEQSERSSRNNHGYMRLSTNIIYDCLTLVTAVSLSLSLSLSCPLSGALCFSRVWMLSGVAFLLVTHHQPFHPYRHTTLAEHRRYPKAFGVTYIVCVVRFDILPFCFFCLTRLSRLHPHPRLLGLQRLSREWFRQPLGLLR